MNPPVAARASASTPSLHDRLKDPSLLRDRCYIDGTWVGTPSRPVTNPVNGVELAKVPAFSTAEATQAVEAAERAFPAWAKLTGIVGVFEFEVDPQGNTKGQLWEWK